METKVSLRRFLPVQFFQANGTAIPKEVVRKVSIGTDANYILQYTCLLCLLFYVFCRRRLCFAMISLISVLLVTRVNFSGDAGLFGSRRTYRHVHQEMPV